MTSIQSSESDGSTQKRIRFDDAQNQPILLDLSFEDEGNDDDSPIETAPILESKDDDSPEILISTENSEKIGTSSTG